MENVKLTDYTASSLNSRRVVWIKTLRNLSVAYFTRETLKIQQIVEEQKADLFLILLCAV